MICLICSNPQGREHTVREMMFGFRETFQYFECAQCGALQLISPPADLAKYYPPDRYYAFTHRSTSDRPRNPVRRMIKRWRDAAILFDGNWFTRQLSKRWKNPGILDVCRWINDSPVKSWRGRILDVGCGKGELLFRLASLGFTSLTGVDPFCKESVQAGNVAILKQSLESLDELPFDLIMFHHVLEHIPDQIATLQKVRELLTPEGVCLVRIPLVSRGPWERYGTDWAEIDAPRHFIIHTELSLSLAAGQAGLHLKRIDYEADPFYYRASEMYRRDIPLCSIENPEKCFTTEELMEFERLAITYNVPGWAGRAAFYLSRQPGNSPILSATC